MARTKSKSKKDVRRRVFLIDFENVKSAGLNGILGLTEDDTVCFFYSENAETMTLDCTDVSQRPRPMFSIRRWK